MVPKMMRVRFPLLLLLGVVFLASVSASFTSRHVSREDCLQTCEKENNPYQKQVCQVSCSLLERDDEEEHGKQPRPRPHPQPQPQPHREEGEEDEGEQPSPRPHHHPGKKDQEHKEDEREQQQPRPHKPHQKEQPREDEDQEDKREKQQQHHHQHQPREKEDEDEDQDRRQLREQESEDQQQGDEEEDSESESPRQGRNPFYFSSDRFQTLFRNQYGQIRLLQRFDKRSRKLQNLENYRILEFRSKPRTLLLPHHDDAEFLLFVQSGRAIITFVNPDNRDSYNLESGDAIRIPAGTTFYLVNPQENENLRIIKLALPVNNPRRIQSFFLSSTEEQQSYLEGFSRDILEASLDTGYEEIHRVLFGDKNRGQRRQALGVFVEISEEQISELRRNAKSSSRKTMSSEDEPFNLRSNKPVHSNNFGKFFEITPEKNPQLKDFDISLSYLDINAGGLLLPNYQSKSTLILAVDNGEAEIELVALRKSQEKQQQEEEQGPREVRRYRAELSQDDIVVVPAGYPFAIKATSAVRLLAFGINAENNQRNFLAGEKDNLLRQLDRQVTDLAFPGSAENVAKLVENLRESYFANAQPQQEERRGKKGPLSSILGALY